MKERKAHPRKIIRRAAKEKSEELGRAEKPMGGTHLLSLFGNRKMPSLKESKRRNPPLGKKDPQRRREGGDVKKKIQHIPGGRKRKERGKKREKERREKKRKRKKEKEKKEEKEREKKTKEREKIKGEEEETKITES